MKKAILIIATALIACTANAQQNQGLPTNAGVLDGTVNSPVKVTVMNWQKQTPTPQINFQPSITVNPEHIQTPTTYYVEVPEKASVSYVEAGLIAAVIGIICWLSGFFFFEKRNRKNEEHQANREVHNHTHNHTHTGATTVTTGPVTSTGAVTVQQSPAEDKK